MKLNANYNTDLADPSSTAFLSLANDVEAGLLPALASQNPSIDDVEVTRFERGERKFE